MDRPVGYDGIFGVSPTTASTSAQPDSSTVFHALLAMIGPSYHGRRPRSHPIHPQPHRDLPEGRYDTPIPPSDLGRRVVERRGCGSSEAEKGHEPVSRFPDIDNVIGKLC
jgi:hypothetical protein